MLQGSGTDRGLINAFREITQMGDRLNMQKTITVSKY